MKEFLNFYEKSYAKLLEKKINVRVIGEYDNLNDSIIEAINKINCHPYFHDSMTFTICFNYGSRQEIIHSIKEIAQAVKNNELNINDIDETVVTNHLYTKDLEPLDLVIRTSGEYRLSNFLLWQISYAELYFTNVLFPDFNKEELYKAILDYQKRDRRFGKIGDK
jgi:undecaprenyl diphosphate synthase